MWLVKLKKEETVSMDFRTKGRLQVHLQIRPQVREELWDQEMPNRQRGGDQASVHLELFEGTRLEMEMFKSSVCGWKAMSMDTINQGTAQRHSCVVPDSLHEENTAIQ